VAALLAGRPAPVDPVLTAPRIAGVRGEPGPDGPPDDPPEAVEQFCAEMRRRRFDLGVELHGGGGNANPMLLRFGARVTAGSRAAGAAPVDRTVPWTPFQHDVMRWLEVVGLVGAHAVRLRPRLTVTAADRAAAAAALAGVDRTAGPLVDLLVDLLVGNDSGPRHLAEAVGAATVGVFTRANLIDVSPLFRARHRVVVSWASRCTVCGVDFLATPCDHGASVLGDITVDDVLGPAVELLDLPVAEAVPLRDSA
jgi:hypothetical protein